MKLVVQSVNRARLTSGDFISEIDKGYLVMVGVSKNDTEFDAKYLAKRLVNLRIFRDENDKCNFSIKDIDGDIMVVSNFTLQANTTHGNRPDFFDAAGSELALHLYELLIKEIKNLGVKNVGTGSFGNHMHIDTVLDGPLTLILESEGRERE